MQTFEYLETNSKHHKEKAQEALVKGKELEQQRNDQGYTWVKTLRGYKQVKL